MSVCEQALVSLSNSAWFCSLARELQRTIAQHGRAKMFAAGEVLFAQGDAPAGIHAILSGQAQVVGLTAEGVEVLMAVLRPGEWTGFLACLDGGPYAFTVAASEPMEVFSLSLSHVQRLFLGDVEGFRALATPELTVSRKIYADLVELVTLSPLQRLARRLQQLASAAYGTTRTSDMIDVSQDQIATSIMASRQWTNHLLGQLDQAGIISISRERIHIRDWSRLTSLVHDTAAERICANGPPSD